MLRAGDVSRYPTVLEPEGDETMRPDQYESQDKLPM